MVIFFQAKTVEGGEVSGMFSHGISDSLHCLWNVCVVDFEVAKFDVKRLALGFVPLS